MKRIPALLVAVLLLLSCLGCSPAQPEKEKTAFQPLYKGFTPVVSDDTDFASVSSHLILLTSAEAYEKFVTTYCPTAAALAPDFGQVFVLADSALYGSRSGENASFEITGVKIENGKITGLVTDSTNPVYAINLGGTGHWFVNLITVDQTLIDPEANRELIFE